MTELEQAAKAYQDKLAAHEMAKANAVNAQNQVQAAEDAAKLAKADVEAAAQDLANAAATADFDASDSKGQKPAKRAKAAA